MLLSSTLTSMANGAGQSPICWLEGPFLLSSRRGSRLRSSCPNDSPDVLSSRSPIVSGTCWKPWERYWGKPQLRGHRLNEARGPVPLRFSIAVAGVGSEISRFGPAQNSPFRPGAGEKRPHKQAGNIGLEKFCEHRPKERQILRA